MDFGRVEREQGCDLHARVVRVYPAASLIDVVNRNMLRVGWGRCAEVGAKAAAKACTWRLSCLWLIFRSI